MRTGVDQSLGFWAERIVGLLIIGAIILACFWIAWPLIGVVAWGGLIAVALSPLHSRLTSVIAGRAKIAAIIMIFILLVVVIIPLSYLPASFSQANDALSAITHNWTELTLPRPPAWLADFPLFGSTIGEKWEAAALASRNVLASLKPYIGPAVQWAAALGASLGLAILQMLLAIILSGVFLHSEKHGLGIQDDRVSVGRWHRGKSGGRRSAHHSQRCPGRDGHGPHLGRLVGDQFRDRGCSFRCPAWGVELRNGNAADRHVAGVDTCRILAFLSG